MQELIELLAELIAKYKISPEDVKLLDDAVQAAQAGEAEAVDEAEFEGEAYADEE